MSGKNNNIEIYDSIKSDYGQNNENNNSDTFKNISNIINIEPLTNNSGNKKETFQEKNNINDKDNSNNNNSNQFDIPVITKNEQFSQNNIQNQNDIQNQNNFQQNINNINESRIGLENLGKASYLNAILQCLGNIDYLKNYFLDKNNIDFIENNIKEMPLSFVFERLYKNLYLIQHNNNVYSPKNILRVLSYKNIIYHNNNKEKNPNDCLIFILNSLHDELNIIDNKKFDSNHINESDRKSFILDGMRKFFNTNNSIISNNFNRFEIKELTCKSCNNITYEFKYYNTIYLDVSGYYKENNKNNITIKDCIKFDSTEKKINLFCKKCNKKCSMGCISKILNSPKIFVFFVDRGDFDEEKLKLSFYLEEEINLNPFIEDKSYPNKFELIGIVSICMKERKYVAFCNSFKEQLWYYFNDEKVNTIKQKKLVFNHNNKEFVPCILFYKLIEKKN